MFTEHNTCVGQGVPARSSTPCNTHPTQPWLYTPIVVCTLFPTSCVISATGKVYVGVGNPPDTSNLTYSMFPTGGSSEDGFAAIKLTALGRPQFLVGLQIPVLTVGVLLCQWSIG